MDNNFIDATYAKYVSETAVSLSIPRETVFDGKFYSGDLRVRPDILSSLGFFQLVEPDEVPEVPEKFHLEARFSPPENGVIQKSYVVVENPPLNRSLSKRKLMNNLKALEIWTQVKAFMEQNGYWDDWEASTTLDEQEEMMQAAVAALKTLLGFTDEQVENIVSKSVAE